MQATPDNAVYEGMCRIGDAEVKELEPLRSFVEREILALSPHLLGRRAQECLYE